MAVLGFDLFGRSLSNSWGSADIGGSWTITLQTGSSDADVNGTQGTITIGVAGQNTQAALASVSAQDVEILVEASSPTLPTGAATFLHIGARTVGTAITGSTRYFGQINLATTGVITWNFVKSVSGTQTAITSATSTGVTVTAGQMFKTRFKCEGLNPTNLYAKVWPSNGAEPSAWSHTTTDSEATLQAVGAVSLRVTSSGSTTTLPIGYAIEQYIASEVTPYRTAVIDLVPFGYWRLGESSGTVAVDEMGNSHGTYTGPTLAVAGLLDGDTDTGAQFDGTNDYVAGSADDLGINDEYTMVAWFKRLGASADAYHTLIQAITGYQGTTHPRILVNSAGTQALYQHTDTGTLTTHNFFLDTTFNDGARHMLVATFDLAEMLLYFDAVTDPPGVAAGSPAFEGGENWQIGAFSTPTTYASNGVIDEVAVYNFGLAQSQLDTLWAAAVEEGVPVLLLGGL